MALKIVTNNPKVQEYCLNNGYDSFFVEGGAQESLFASRELLLKGWRLALDPLAGYLSRPNPYHTVILQEHLKEEVISDDIMRIEHAVAYWNRYTNIIKMTPKLNDDYCELDFSLATSSIQGLLRTPTYYACL